MKKPPINAADERIVGPEHAQAVSVTFFDKKELADLMHCSPRHIDRMREAGKLPAPIKLGALVRWPRRTVLEWIAAGCPAVPQIRK